MNEEPITPEETEDDDLLPEYDFDYSQARPNPFIERVPGSKLIFIEPDVATTFATQEEVNNALRYLMKITRENPLNAKPSSTPDAPDVAA